MRCRQLNLHPCRRHRLHVREVDAIKKNHRRYDSAIIAVAWNTGLASSVRYSLNLRPMQAKHCGRSVMRRKVRPTNTTNSTLSAYRKKFKRNESGDDETPSSNRLDNVSIRLAVIQRAIQLLKAVVVLSNCEEVGRRRSYLRRPLNSRELKIRGLMSARRHQPVKEHPSLSLKVMHNQADRSMRRD
jgi:hypothetical protein